MQVAIISDIHDNTPKLRAALSNLEHADVLVCCGDLCSPFIIEELASGFGGPTHIVFGNNDGDRYRISQEAKKYPQIQIHGEFVEMELGGRRFAINHFDDLGRAMAGAADHDVVCFGHSHQFEITRQGETLVINPGEIYGLRTGQSTFVMYDTEVDKATRVDVE